MDNTPSIELQQLENTTSATGCACTTSTYIPWGGCPYCRPRCPNCGRPYEAQPYYPYLPMWPTLPYIITCGVTTTVGGNY